MECQKHKWELSPAPQHCSVSTRLDRARGYPALHPRTSEGEKRQHCVNICNWLNTTTVSLEKTLRNSQVPTDLGACARNGRLNSIPASTRQVKLLRTRVPSARFWSHTLVTTLGTVLISMGPTKHRKNSKQQKLSLHVLYLSSQNTAQLWLPHLMSSRRGWSSAQTRNLKHPAESSIQE